MIATVHQSRDVRAGRQARAWHPKFKEYMEFIVKHPNYAGMPGPRKGNGSVRWVVTPKSSLGVRKWEWWNKKREELGIEEKIPWAVKVARVIHPTGEKPCQICGRVMKLDYVYPTRRTVSRLNKAWDLKLSYKDFLTIEEILNRIFQVDGKPYKKIRGIFNIPEDVKRSKETYLKHILENPKRKLSPGAMSDVPDRFDGFHTYNICCRKVEDRGRHPEGMARYVRDRRTYENWCDGDWKAASRLMGEFRKIKRGKCIICGREGPISADHIGPISLGFGQGKNPRLRPMCRSCNSSRRNRLTLEDVRELIRDESAGNRIVSWHSQYIWDKLKNLVKSDRDAQKLSQLMRRNMHHVLIILSDIQENGSQDFLKKHFLHPEKYAYQDVKFEGFNPSTGGYDKITRIRGSKKQYENSVRECVRVAFESLREYQEESRRVLMWENPEVDELVELVLDSLRRGEEEKALHHLHEALKKLAGNALVEYRGSR